MQVSQSQIPFQLQAHREGRWVVLSQHYTVTAANKKIKIWKKNGRPDEDLRIIERGQSDFITEPRSYSL